MTIKRKNTQEITNPPLLIASVGRSSYSFRAWNTETKKMMQWSDIKKFGNLTKLISLNHVVIMQDINFKGLFEGDIVQDNVGIGYVVYSPSRNSHIVRYQNQSYKYIGDYLLSEEKSIKLLGNVFQNGYLL